VVCAHVRRSGTQLVVIDPGRRRTARLTDWHLPIRVGTDAALARGVMHILVRDRLCDRKYLAGHTVRFERVEREILPGSPPDRAAAITGLSTADIERFAALYGAAKASFIRLGEGDPPRARWSGIARGGIAAGRDRRLWQKGRGVHCYRPLRHVSSIMTLSASLRDQRKPASSTTCALARPCSS